MQKLGKHCKKCSDKADITKHSRGQKHRLGRHYKKHRGQECKDQADITEYAEYKNIHGERERERGINVF